MTTIIPKVQVPMDFGVQYLGSPSHSNLKFLLESGEELLANSMIISYNSPVIENLTTNLFQSTIEVQDFSKNAVQCFLEASYSGDIKKISQSNFRDVNKMGHVFDVDWIVDRCYKYFKSLTEAVKDNNYSNQLFVFKEAMFMFNKLKKRNFVNLVIKKFNSLASCTKNFVTNYLSDVSSCPTICLDVIIEMTGKEEDILIRVLVNHLENNKSVIDLNTRYILERLTFMSCQAAHKSLYRELIDKLEGIDNPSKEDFKLVVGVLKRCNNVLFDKMVVDPYAAVPNLFHDFQQLQDINDLDTLTTFLVESPVVTNSYIFYDAVFCWLLDKRINITTPFVTIPESFVDKFSDTMTSRGWSPLPREYIDTEDKKHAKFGGLTPQIMKNVNMITENQNNRIVSISEYTPDELFGRNHDIKFKFKQDTITNCSKEGECGFILRVTAASCEQDDLFKFNILLVIDPNRYPADIHFHEESSSLIGDCHLALDITSVNGCYYKDWPVTWNGKPCRYGTNKYWCWGAQWFYSTCKAEGHPSPGLKYKWGYCFGATAKIRPVVYLFKQASRLMTSSQPLPSQPSSSRVSTGDVQTVTSATCSVM